MIFCMSLSRYRYKLQDKVDEVIFDYKMKTTKEQRQKVKRVVITTVMVMAALIILSSNVSAIGANELDSNTKDILYYHFKKLHYPDAQIEKCIRYINQEDVERIVNKLTTQRFLNEGNIPTVIIYSIIIQLFRLSIMKIRGGM